MMTISQRSLNKQATLWKRWRGSPGGWAQWQSLELNKGIKCPFCGDHRDSCHLPFHCADGQTVAREGAQTFQGSHKSLVRAQLGHKPPNLVLASVCFWTCPGMYFRCSPFLSIPHSLSVYIPTNYKVGVDYNSTFVACLLCAGLVDKHLMCIYFTDFTDTPPPRYSGSCWVFRKLIA